MIRLSFLLVFICFGCSQSIVVRETHSTLPVQTYSQDSLYIYFTGGFLNDSLLRPNHRYSTEIINKEGNFIEVWYCKEDILKHYQRTEPFRFD